MSTDELHAARAEKQRLTARILGVPPTKRPRWTAGRWQVGTGSNPGELKGHAVCAGVEVVARVTGFPTSSHGHADTALICSAPDLYAALEAMVEAVRSPNSDAVAVDAAVTGALSVMRQARGGA